MERADIFAFVITVNESTNVHVHRAWIVTGFLTWKIDEIWLKMTVRSKSRESTKDKTRCSYDFVARNDSTTLDYENSIIISISSSFYLFQFYLFQFHLHFVFSIINSSSDSYRFSHFRSTFNSQISGCTKYSSSFLNFSSIFIERVLISYFVEYRVLNNETSNSDLISR